MDAGAERQPVGLLARGHGALWVEDAGIVAPDTFITVGIGEQHRDQFAVT